MKSFIKYLTESERTYQYRIKFCGDVDSDAMKMIKSKLDQFDPVKIGDLRTTPVQAIPTDFPNHRNESVSMFDVSFRYPAVEPQIKQICQLAGCDPNRVCMQDKSYADSMVDEYAKIKDQNQDLLKDTDYPADSAEQRALKKDYSAEPHDHAVLKNAYHSDFTVAGGRTPPAKTTNDLPQGQNSPMTRIKRPPKPATGAQPRG
jgi:hypothetical protein